MGDKMKHQRYKIAVSEIIGTFILLAMVISAFSIIYFQVLSDKGPEYNTFVRIGGRVESRNVILEHKGGELLDLDTELSIIIAGIEYNGTSGPSVGPWEPYTGPFVVSQPGNYIIHYYSVDKVGNIEPEQIKGFTILDDDVTPPVTTIHLAGTQVP